MPKKSTKTISKSKAKKAVKEKQKSKLRNRGYVYAFDRNQDTEVYTYLAKAFGCVRKLKNFYVDQLYQKLEKEAYENGFTKMKLQEVSSIKAKYDYMKEIDSLAYSNAKKHIESAISKYNKEFLGKGFTKRALKRQRTLGEVPTFRDLKGMPSFHSKKDKQSFTTNNQIAKNGTHSIKLIGNELKLPIIGKKHTIKLIMHRPLPDGWALKSVTISKNVHGQYFASILMEEPAEVVLVPRKPIKTIGLDYSQQHFYVDSNGETANPHKSYRKAERHLGRMQRALARKEYGSESYNKLKAKINKLNCHIANQRKDFAHKVSRNLANTYDYVFLEDINLNNLGQTLRLAKNLHDMGFGMFREYLKYKLSDKGGASIKVDKMYPSSKLCSSCGAIYKDLKLSDRTYICHSCGMVMNRDKNAAINIQAEGLRMLGC